MISVITKYFPDLTERQRAQYESLYGLYADWNAKINVVSRKDFDQLYLRHAGARILDVGCGGGFPSVPLAIMFPEARFTAADSIGKKITVVRGVCEGAGIANIDARNVRVEQIGEKFDYVVSRAVTEMPAFVKWIRGKVERGRRGTLDNGILYLKGGDLAAELAATRMKWREYAISEFFDEDFFETKKVVYSAV